MSGAIGNHVAITITADSVGVARAGFGKPLVLSAEADWSERYREFASLSELAADSASFSTTGPTYLAVQAIFAQSPKPLLVGIGRSALPPTQVYALDVSAVRTASAYAVNVKGDGVTATAISLATKTNIVFNSTFATDTLTSAAHAYTTGDGPYRLTTSAADLPSGLVIDTDYWIIRVDADDFQLAASYADAIATTQIALADDGSGTHTINTATNDVIMTGLVDRLNSVTGNNYVAVLAGSPGSHTLTVTADVAGDWFSIEVLDRTALRTRQTHVDPGVATDLAAIAVENNTWYGLITCYNSEAYAIATAAWTQSNGRMYFVDSAESDIEQVTADGTVDTFDDLATLGYNRTTGMYHPAPNQFAAAAWAGGYLSRKPGSATAKFDRLTGVAPVNLTATQRARIIARNANSYETVRGVDITFEGTTFAGPADTYGFIDVRRDIDWLQDDMESGVFSALAGAAKVPRTDEGMLVIDNQVRASLLRAVARTIFTNDPAPLTEVPFMSSATQVALEPRGVTMSWSATLAGAIHTVTITGVVTIS